MENRKIKLESHSDNKANYHGGGDYRPDIDGLRAVAVSLVVLYHFGIGEISGGFVGVDVFFVISGFLITSIVYKKLLQGTFSFSEFYVRRIRRLMPALVFVLAISLILYSFILLPLDLVKFAKSIIWVSTYLGNFFFWREYGGYFGDNALEAPLLHTWSLAVEEQYYLLWPVFVLLGVRFLNRRSLLLLSAAACVTATLFSEWTTKVTLGAAYYLLPPRFFELMIGSMLALAWDRLPNPSKLVADILSLLGFTLILVSAFVLSKGDSFPGYNALYATIGAAILIYTYRGSGIINTLLSLKPFVLLGLISYSLYLWHWPIVVFTNYTVIEKTPSVHLAMTVFAIAFAIFSWRYIEQPFRKINGAANSKVIGNLYVKPTAILVSLCLLIVLFKGFPARFNDQIVEMDKALHADPDNIRIGCHSPLRNSEADPSPTCYLGAKDEPRFQAFMVGDSHANHFTGFIDEIAKTRGVAVMDYTMDACPPIFGLYPGGNSFKASRCKARNDKARLYLRSHDFDYVILAADWLSLKSNAIFEDGKSVDDPTRKTTILEEKIEATVAEIVTAGASPILIKDAPDLLGVNANCSIKKALFDKSLDCTVANRSDQFMDDYLGYLQNKYPSLVVIEPRNVMCVRERCSTEQQHVPLYRDSEHLNDIGSRLLGRQYLTVVGDPFHLKVSGASALLALPALNTALGVISP